jgi:hypothetical protein
MQWGGGEGDSGGEGLGFSCEKLSWIGRNSCDICDDRMWPYLPNGVAQHHSSRPIFRWHAHVLQQRNKMREQDSIVWILFVSTDIRCKKNAGRNLSNWRCSGSLSKICAKEHSIIAQTHEDRWIYWQLLWATFDNWMRPSTFGHIHWTF